MGVVAGMGEAVTDTWHTQSGEPVVTTIMKKSIPNQTSPSHLILGDTSCYMHVPEKHNYFALPGEIVYILGKMVCCFKTEFGYTDTDFSGNVILG